MKNSLPRVWGVIAITVLALTIGPVAGGAHVTVLPTPPHTSPRPVPTY